MTKMLKAKEAADFLNVHLETIRRLARQNEIPAFKVGKGWRFSEETLKKWADEHYSRNAAPHILVIDDETAGCKLVTRLLEPEGYRVSSALGGRQALESMSKAIFDLILLDLMMPEMNGVETLKEIRKIDEKIPVIIITGFPDSELLYEAMSISPVLMIPKPLDKKQLFSAISMLLPEKEQRA